MLLTGASAATPSRSSAAEEFLVKIANSCGSRPPFVTEEGSSGSERSRSRSTQPTTHPPQQPGTTHCLDATYCSAVHPEAGGA